MKIVNTTEHHLNAILEIYNSAVRNTFAVWTEREDTLNDRRAWVLKLQSHGFACIVALDDDGKVVGYAGYGSFRGKPGYDITVEHSVYVAEDAQGKGIGKALMSELLNRAKQDSRLEKMIGAIDAGNPISIKMHESFGFQTEGILRGIATKWGEHRDLQLMIKDIS